MLTAIDGTGHKIAAKPGMLAYCPDCGELVRARCGKIRMWHFTHISSPCDIQSEPETQWHLRWKSQVPSEQTEVRFGDKRADVVTEDRNGNLLVVEFQHSPIRIDEVRARELCYGNMIWIFDARYKFQKGHLSFLGGLKKIKHRLYGKDRIRGWECESCGFGSAFEGQRKVYCQFKSKQCRIRYEERDYAIRTYPTEEYGDLYIKWCPKAWQHTKRPSFLDIGDDYLYEWPTAVTNDRYDYKRWSKKLFIECLKRGNPYKKEVKHGTAMQSAS